MRMIQFQVDGVANSASAFFDLFLRDGPGCHVEEICVDATSPSLCPHIADFILRYHSHHENFYAYIYDLEVNMDIAAGDLFGLEQGDVLDIYLDHRPVNPSTAFSSVFFLRLKTTQMRLNSCY